MASKVITDLKGKKFYFEDPKWRCYILHCNDGTYYTGITTDVDRRFKEHNDDHKGRGAKYTRTRRPLKLVWLSGYFDTRSEVMQTERSIKKLTRRQKINLIESQPNRHLL